MKARVVNQSNKPVPVLALGPAVPVGESKVFYGLDMAKAARLQALTTEGVVGVSKVTVTVEFGPEDFPAYQARMANPSNPSSGVKSLAAVGFDLFIVTDGQGSNGTGTAGAVGVATAMGLCVYDDADCLVPSETATLHTASGGASITNGSGTNRVEVLTTGAGVFRCTVEIPVAAAKVVYLKAFALPSTGRVVDCASVDAVTFSV